MHAVTDFHFSEQKIILGMKALPIPLLALHTFFLSTVSRDANYILKEKDSVSPLTRAPRAAWCESQIGQEEEWKHDV
jgi:hypothetical protein